ncbi:MAG: hypothetical protein H6707_20360 [Deltaproteobacteria bacterium]|nr:hypothetical protein [Deltaproteobacteria bacterium]
MNRFAALALRGIVLVSLFALPAPATGIGGDPATSALIEATGVPEIPRYIKFHELDPDDRTRVLLAPTLQRGMRGRPIVLRRGVPYLYAVAVDGTFLVAERDRCGKHSCGHPQLTGALPARISGEMHYDARTDHFVLDNDSGRYGFQLTRRRAQLYAALALLRHYGVRFAGGGAVRVVAKWIKPWDSPEMRRWDRIRPFLKGCPADFDAAEWRRRFVQRMGFAVPRA